MKGSNLLILEAFISQKLCKRVSSWDVCQKIYEIES